VDIVVRDDGNGFDTGAAAMSPGFGLLGMRERIALAGATLAVSARPGRVLRSEREFRGVAGRRLVGRLRLRRNRQRHAERRISE
jgi:glucose-6-phosphate-specific signal transduction histidine kinase